MKLAAEDVEHRLSLMSGLMYAGYRIGMWCFSKKEKLFYSTSLHSEEFQLFLKISDILNTLIACDSENPQPIVFTDQIGLIWIGERVNLKGGGAIFVFCGPAFHRKNTKNAILLKLKELNLSLFVRLKYSRILDEIEPLDPDEIRTIYQQLHFDIYEEYLPVTALQISSGQSGESDQFSDGIDVKANSDRKVPDAIDYAQMKHLETELLNAVRTGMGSEEKQNPDHYYGDFVDYGLPDELRSLKDELIIFVSKCMEASLEGGLSLEAAKAMERDGIHRIEGCRTSADAATCNWEIYQGYIQAVAEAKKNMRNGVSEPVRVTMDYIRRNYNQPLSLSKLASAVGYSGYYLSRKFSKETGMKLTDYIRDVRMKMAKVMLVSTRLSIFQIAEQLQYNSRSYFDRTFTEYVGVTPAQYRERHGLMVTE